MTHHHRGHRRGFLLDAETQAALTGAQSWVAYNTARRHAAAGANVDAAAQRGAMAGPLTVGFWLLVAPPAAMILLLTLGSLGRPELLIWDSGTIFAVSMQYLRLRQWRDSPIGTPRRAPSGVFFAIVGAVWFYGGFLLIVLARLTS
jgi:hypothetical protein